MSQDDLLEELRLTLALKGKLPMTIGLGMLGRDGWVLASDTLAVETMRVKREDEQHSFTVASFPTDTRKIIWQRDAKLIFAWSGNHLSRLTGEEICRRYAAGRLSSRVDSISLVSVAREIRQQYHQVQQGIEIDIPTVLLLSTEPPISMWTVYVRGKPEAFEQTSKQLIGDLNNGAKLFPSLYYSRQQSTKDLVKLAAHTLLAAHLCAPGVIDGLDIWTGDAKGNVRQLGDEELADLSRQSRDIDAMIRRTFNL
jgi:hypothetical protein